MTLTAPAQSLSVAQAIAVVRQDWLDTDANNYVLTDAEITNELNNIWLAWQAANGNRYTRLNATAAWGAINSQSAPGRSALSVSSTVLEWKELFDEGSITGSDPRFGIPLEIMSVQDLILHQREAGTGVPRYAAVSRVTGVDTSDIGKWYLYLSPMPSATRYVSALVRNAPYTIGGSTSDVLDCTPAEFTLIAHATAALLAERWGESPTMIDGLWALAGKDLQQILSRTKRAEPEAATGANG